MKKYLLFDLDGTLTDPKVGITTCVQYALHSFGIEEPDLDKLEPFIGPPLKESFQKFYNMDDAQAEAAIAKYRERFQDTGIFENELYDGIPEMLHTLQSKGLFLAVASSKPTVYVERILEHFQIDKYFKVVVGSELDGTRVNKDEVVQEALHRLFGDQPIQTDQVYMIGDRKFDVEGAKALGIESVAVTYGYGSMEELKSAKADYIVQSVEELKAFLLRGTEETGQKKGTNFQRIWIMLYSFLIFMLVRNVVQYALVLLLSKLAEGMPGLLPQFLCLEDETGNIILTGNTMTLISALGFIGGMIPNLNTAKVLISKTANDMKLSHLKKEPTKNYVLIGLAAVGAVIGLNLLYELAGWTNESSAYQSVLENQYSAHFLVGILCFGIVSPIAEEILFRGIIYNYLKRFTKLRIAVILSAFFFGAYHVNSIQGSYAFLMSLLIIYAYEYFGDFRMPVLIHCISNILAYSMFYTSIAVSGFISWPVCIIALVVCGVSLWFLRKQKRVF